MTVALAITAGFAVYCVAVGAFLDGKPGARDGALAFATIAVPAWIIGGIIA